MKITLSIGVLLAVSSQVFAQDFKTFTASGIDMRNYQTFNVIRGTVISGSDQPIDKEAFYKDIKPAIVKELEMRGYTFREDSAVDMSVSYVIETTVRLDVQRQGHLGQQVVVTNPAAGNPSQSWSREFTQGMLILQIEDTARKTAIWSAEGVMDINRTRGGNLLENAVRSAFRKFPDKTRKGKKPKK